MSADFNPYAAPHFDQTYQPATGRRPGLLTAICVIAIILGGFGLLSSLGGLVSAIFLPWIQSTFSTPATGSGPMQVQAEMQGEMNKVTTKFRPVNIALAVLQFPITVGLLVGGFMSLSGKQRGRKLLLGGCLAAIGFIVIQTIFALIMQWQTAEVMTNYMPKLIASQPGGAGGANSQAAQQMVTSMMSAGVYLGIALVIIIAVVKLIYFGLSAAYLNKSQTRAFFGES